MVTLLDFGRYPDFYQSSTTREISGTVLPPSLAKRGHAPSDHQDPDLIFERPQRRDCSVSQGYEFLLVLLTLQQAVSHEQVVPGVSINAESVARAAERHAQ